MPPTTVLCHAVTFQSHCSWLNDTALSCVTLAKKNGISHVIFLFWYILNLKLAWKDILAQTVPRHVHLTVDRTRVVTRTDGVLVLQDGRVIIVQQVFWFRIFNYIFKILGKDNTSCFYIAIYDGIVIQPLSVISTYQIFLSICQKILKITITRVFRRENLVIKMAIGGRVWGRAVAKKGTPSVRITFLTVCNKGSYLFCRLLYICERFAYSFDSDFR